MLVIGMDPSMSNWGYALCDLNLDTLTYQVLELETVRTEKIGVKSVRVSSDDLRRARTLSAALKRWAAHAKIAFVEVPHGAQSARGMVSNAMVIGLLASLEIPIVELRESDLKLATLGRKTGTKREAIEWGLANHPEAPWPRTRGRVPDSAEHVADAVAAVQAGIVSAEFANVLAVLRYAQAS